MNEIATIESASYLGMIERAARDPTVDVGKMAALLDLQERLIAKRAEAEFNQAFALMAAELRRIKKNGAVEYPEDKRNPDGPRKKAFNFARYEDIDEVIRPIELRHGFSRSFTTARAEGGGIVVSGTLMHVGGHSKTAEIGPLPLDASGGKNNLQGAGSTFSYGKRYTTTMLLNLVFEGQDDDGVRGGTQFIDATGVAEIEKLLAERDVPRAGFLDYMQAEAVEHIEVKDYTRAINALMRAKRKPSKGEV